MGAIFQQLGLQQQQAAAPPPRGAHLLVEGLCFHPPGAPAPLLSGVSLELAPNQLGLIYGRSGGGKTTLLQVLAGLVQQSGGGVSFSGPGGLGRGSGGANGAGSAEAAAGLPAEQRMAVAGLVFQFPERHFVGGTLSEELTVGWPAALTPAAEMARQELTSRTLRVLKAVGLDGLPLDAPLASLSGGYKRRVALAVQLVRRPALLLLDEPLAGLDWRARVELIQLLGTLRSECTVLVVSHDLRELAAAPGLVGAAWEVLPGGRLRRSALGELPVSAAVGRAASG